MAEESDSDVTCHPCYFNLYREYLTKEALAKVSVYKLGGRINARIIISITFLIILLIRLFINKMRISDDKAIIL